MALDIIDKVLEPGLKTSYSDATVDLVKTFRLAFSDVDDFEKLTAEQSANIRALEDLATKWRKQSQDLRNLAYGIKIKDFYGEYCGLGNSDKLLKHILMLVESSVNNPPGYEGIFPQAGSGWFLIRYLRPIMFNQDQFGRVEELEWTGYVAKILAAEREAGIETTKRWQNMGEPAQKKLEMLAKVKRITPNGAVNILAAADKAREILTEHRPKKDKRSLLRSLTGRRPHDSGGKQPLPLPSAPDPDPDSAPAPDSAPPEYQPPGQDPGRV